MSLQVAEGIAAPAKDAVCPGNLEGKDEQEDANAEHGDANARHEARVECPRQDLAAQPENSSAEHAGGEINWESDSNSRPRNVERHEGPCCCCGFTLSFNLQPRAQVEEGADGLNQDAAADKIVEIRAAEAVDEKRHGAHQVMSQEHRPFVPSTADDEQGIHRKI